MNPAPYLPAIERAHMLAMLDLTTEGLLMLGALAGYFIAETFWRTR